MFKRKSLKSVSKIPKVSPQLSFISINNKAVLRILFYKLVNIII